MGRGFTVWWVSPSSVDWFSTSRFSTHWEISISSRARGCVSFNRAVLQSCNKRTSIVSMFLFIYFLCVHGYQTSRWRFFAWAAPRLSWYDFNFRLSRCRDLISSSFFNLRLSWYDFSFRLSRRRDLISSSFFNLTPMVCCKSLKVSVRKLTMASSNLVWRLHKQAKNIYNVRTFYLCQKPLREFLHNDLHVRKQFTLTKHITFESGTYRRETR